VVVGDAGHVRQEVGHQREREVDAGVTDLHGDVAGVEEHQLAAAAGVAGGRLILAEPHLLAGDALPDAQAIDHQRREIDAGPHGREIEAAILDEARGDLERGLVPGGLVGGLQHDLDASEAAWRARLGDAVGRPRFIDDARTRDEPDSRKRHGGARPAMSGERGPAHGLWCTATRRGCHGSRRRARCGPWDWARNGRHKAVSAGALALRLAAQVSRPGRPEVARQVTDPGLRAAQAAVVIAVQIA
jgi:hypothetical protein